MGRDGSAGAAGGLGGEAAAAPRLVHPQDVPLQQAEDTLLAAGSPGPGKTRRGRRPRGAVEALSPNCGVQMQSSEEGLQRVDQLVQTYRHCCCWFLGPFYHLVRVFHPDYVKPLLMASGESRNVRSPNPDLTLLSCPTAKMTVKDDLIYGHLRPWLGEFHALCSRSVFKIKRPSSPQTHPRTKSVAKQRGGVVPQETTADSSLSLRRPERVCLHLQLLHPHHARKTAAMTAAQCTAKHTD